MNPERDVDARWDSESGALAAGREPCDVGNSSPVVRGPHAWLNWRAAAAGQPARISSREGVLIVPLWEEFGLYSDAAFTGGLEIGPIELMLAFPPRRPTLGRSQLSLVLRVRDHLEVDYPPTIPESEETEAYAGGDIADEIASILSLALTRRLRSGGLMRRGTEDDEKGVPFFGWHHPPDLGEARSAPMVPRVADDALLEEAQPYLYAYAGAASEDAVALLRAAHQFADALWLADTDARVAWIKMFGALEAAANRWDVSADSDEIAQLRRHLPSMCKKLDKKAPDALPIVAKAISRTTGVQSKMLGFIRAFPPAPPAVRPPLGAQVDWGCLAETLKILYHHRSADLHGGVPFPQPLCDPPQMFDGVPAERFPGVAATSGGGRWPAERMPMYFPTFVHVVGETLRAWWRSLGCRGESTERDDD